MGESIEIKVKRDLFLWPRFVLVAIVTLAVSLCPPVSNRLTAQPGNDQNVVIVGLRARLTGNKGEVVLRFSPDGHTLVTGGNDGFL